MKLGMIVLAGLVIACVASGCGPAPTATPVPTPTPQVLGSADDLVGTWQDSAGAAHFRFNADGSLNAAESKSALETMAMTGTWRFEGGRILVTDSACEMEGSYLVEILASEGGKPSQIQFRDAKDACQQGRRDVYLKTKWMRVTP